MDKSSPDGVGYGSGSVYDQLAHKQHACWLALLPRQLVSTLERRRRLHLLGRLGVLIRGESERLLENLGREALRLAEKRLRLEGTR